VTPPIRLLVGLGNPGSKYAETRHNVGAWLVEELSRHHHVNLRADSKFHGTIGNVKINGHECWLLIPTTFMNLSGTAVQAMASYYKITPEEILVAHDELDFPAGQVRFKQHGGHGGHNGLRDIIAKMHSPAFHRLRLGIDHPGDRNEVVNYVLKPPRNEEHTAIMAAIRGALEVLPTFIAGDQQKAIRELHSTASGAQ
jgi:PTH1 family peptidyl-tRNA hydrolase